MSRKWERMVQKNRKQADAMRKKQGKQAISSGGDMDLFAGRNVVLPFFLFAVGILYSLSFAGQQGSMYWFTVIAYLLLAMYFFFLKKPYLKVGKSQISTRKWAAERTVSAKEIDRILVEPGYVIIRLSGKKKQWVFSRTFNLFKIDQMASRLKQFSQQNGIEFRQKIS